VVPQIRLPLKRGRTTATASQQVGAFEDRAARDRGIAIHSLLELVTWLPAYPEELPTWLAERLDSHRFGEPVRRLLNSPEGRAYFVQPEGQVELHRERTLEWIDRKGLWNTARIDRYTVEHGSDGGLRIRVIDFKTDQDAQASQYQFQLKKYAEALTAVYGEVLVETIVVGV